jgi:hypothetical protein
MGCSDERGETPVRGDEGGMSTLISTDLRSRLVVQPRAYQFEAADNLYDLNWVQVFARLSGPHTGSGHGQHGRVVRTRLTTWDLDGIAAQCLQLAEGQRALWHPRFFDSGLHMWIRRSTDRNDTCQVTALLSSVTGPLPVEALDHWHGDRLAWPDPLLEGLRFRCTRDALALFAHELRESLQGFPVRALQKTG